MSRARPKPLYTAADLEGVPHLDSLPGAAPFLRGPHASMYTGRPWTIRQYAGFATAEESNAFFHASLRAGVQGLSVAFDLPTHRGYDSDHAHAAADVGRAGVAIDSVEDMARLFAGIDLGAVSVSMTMSGAVLPVLACFIVAAEESGVPQEALAGTIQNDILKEFMVRNTYIHAPRPSLRIAADVAQYLAESLPRFHPMSVSGYHFQEAGAGAALELALTMANGETYLRLLQERGLDIERSCSRLSFFFGVGRDFYTEIAKLRAARVLWQELATGCGVRDPKSAALRMHCQTSGWTLSAHEPGNNIVRTTVQAMAAAFGGTQSLHTNAYDEALALPGDEAARVARNTQLILQHETGICDTIDPWAGSYMMERLTHDLVQQGRALMGEIHAQGGVLGALESGWIRRAIDEQAAAAQARIDRGEHIIVGQNRYASQPGGNAACRSIDGDAIRATQAERLRGLRAARDARAVQEALAVLTDCAASGVGNLLRATIEAVRRRATVGECCAALAAVWPRYRAAAAFPTTVYGAARDGDEGWRAACAQVAATTARLARPPRILIAKLGQDGHDRGAKAIAGALSDAGFEAILGPLFQTPVQAATMALEQGVDVLGISTLAGGHLALLRDLRTALDAGGGTRLPLFVGGIIPAEDHAALARLGVTGVFAPGSPVDQIIAALLSAI